MSVGKSSGESKSSGTSYTPTQEKYLTQALDIYGGTLGKNEPSRVYQGLRVAPLTSTQSNILNNVSNTANQTTDQITSQIPLFGETSNTLTGLLNQSYGAQPLSVDQANQTFNQTRVNPSQKNWMENIAPSLKEEYSGGGYWGTARADAVAKSQQDMADTLASQRSQFLWDTEQTNRDIAENKANRALSATGQAITFGQLPTTTQANQLSNLTSAYNLASQGQTQAQNEINAAMQKFAEENQITNTDDLTVLLSLLGMNYSSNSSSGSSSSISLGL